MSLKSTILGAFSIALGMFISNNCDFFLLGSLGPEMIYKTPNMPDFNDQQDYSRNKYQALVRLETKKGGFFCSGTVISDDYVLTAAHCLMKGGFVSGMTKEDINVISLPMMGETSMVVAKAAAINNRADYGLIRGNFKEFTKMKILYKPDMFAYLVGPNLTCGFPWGAENVCYTAGGSLRPYLQHLITDGILYPGMSGGPAVDIGANAVFAVNTAMTEGGGIIISPLIGLFETLGVKVIK